MLQAHRHINDRKRSQEELQALKETHLPNQACPKVQDRLFLNSGICSSDTSAGEHPTTNNIRTNNNPTRNRLLVLMVIFHLIGHLFLT